MLRELRRDLKALATETRAEKSARYFKTGKGEYGEGDIFLGVTVPDTRQIAKQYRDLEHKELDVIANSKYHEERLCALLILNYKYSKSEVDEERKEIFDYWLSLVANYKVNNWDLIDTSAPVLGEILSRHIGYNAAFMHSLAKSDNLWERRAAIILTFPLIKKNKFGPTLALARDLFDDQHDLIHKATGWMLREVGNRDEETLTEFLNKHKHQMPRTMLRYAIEKYGPKQRAKFLAR